MQASNQSFFLFILLVLSSFPILNLSAQDCDQWNKVANEGQSFQLSGTRTVRYGARGKFVYKNLSGTQVCNNRNFGDPAPGVPKQCHVCAPPNPNASNHTFSRIQQPDRTDIKEVGRDTDGDYVCTSEKIDAASSFNTNFVLEGSGLESVIYPGALVYGEDILEGRYNTINVPRQPISVSASVSFVNGNPSMSLRDPNRLSSVRTDINQLMVNQVRGKIQATSSFQKTQVYNEKQLEIAFSGRFSRKGLSVSGAFGMHQGSKKNTIVARFLQKYYTIDVDHSQSPADFFKNDSDHQRLLDQGGTPLYVSQVVYGRAAYFFLETEENSLEIEAKLDAAYTSVVGKAEAKARTQVNELLRKSTLRVLVIGGGTAPASNIINGYEGFKKAILEGSELHASSIARPVAYTLRYLDGEMANMNVTTNYTKRQCVKNTNTYRITINRIVLKKQDPREPGIHNEVGGYIRIRATADGAKTTFEENGTISPVGAPVPTFSSPWGDFGPRMITHPKPGTPQFHSAKFHSAYSNYDIRSSAGGRVLLQENQDGSLAGDYISVNHSTTYKINATEHRNVRFHIRVAISEKDVGEVVLKEAITIPKEKAYVKDQFIELRDRDIYRVYYSIEPVSE